MINRHYTYLVNQKLVNKNMYSVCGISDGKKRKH